MLRIKFKALNSYIRNEERAWVNNLSSYLKKPEKDQSNKPKASRRGGITKIRTGINVIEKL